MKWYYKTEGIHTRVRVFMNGALCGDLCFRNEEFKEVQIDLRHVTNVIFIDETPQKIIVGNGDM